MSKTKPETREELIDWCLTQLGHPVIEINVDEQQIENAIESAIQYFQDFHSDGTERTYLKHEITSEDITNQYIQVSPNVIGINRIFPMTGGVNRVNMFDLRYQLRLHDLYDFANVSFVNYVLTMQHLRTIDMLFNGEKPVRYNRHTDKLYIDWDWQNDIKVGDWIIMEAFVIVDPDTYSKVYNDRLLKRLATAHLKKIWGANMSKFAGMQLPGGVTMNGPQIYKEAVEEIALVEQLIRDAHEPPPMPLIG